MKIVNVVLNNFLNDSRVLKTSNSLLRLGNEVSVVALHDDKLKENELIRRKGSSYEAHHKILA